jgi:hypothetical protein
MRFSLAKGEKVCYNAQGTEGGKPRAEMMVFPPQGAKIKKLRKVE